jgi:thiamine-phosphate pyrophosphorylase
MLDVFYPIVPDCGWLARFSTLGLKTVQLRVKDAPPQEITREVLMAAKLAKTYAFTLIVNDFWQAAIDANVGFVHLGQEDLATADVKALKARGIRIGVSTHTPEELETALAIAPDYVALGPIYETRLKAMPYPPQGLDRIGVWKNRIGEVPLVAIGGITPERATQVLAAGADSVAVITDFMTAPHPEARVALWVDWALAQGRSKTPAK